MKRLYSTKTMLSKEDLCRLYLTEKKSAQQIAEQIGCSAQKVSYWLTSYGIPKRSISDALYLRHNPAGDPFTFESPSSARAHFLFGLGLGLYWGEGNKKNKTAIRLGNADPDLVLAFVRFLKEMYRVKEDKFRFGLQLFSDIEPESALRFWVKKLNVSRRSFGKVIVTPARGVGTYKEKSRYGVVTVYVSNKKLRDLVCEEIEKLRGMR